MPPQWVTTLPAANAMLNGLATVLLVTGFVKIRQGRRAAHKKLMLTTMGVSVLFLACYLVYHFALQHYTGSSSKKFPGTGIARTVYLCILLTHVVLAAAVPILASITIVKGLRAERRAGTVESTPSLNQNWESHRRWAKVTFPIWLYVSITGVIIYLMVYHWPIPVAG